MPASEYSFIDIAVLDDVRGRFAAGDALAILSGDLEEVIWANGPGARLFGYPDIEAIMGAAAGLGLAQKRQIAATPGYPRIGTDRPLVLRLNTRHTSSAVAFLASAVTLPDGERAIMLAAPAAAAGARDATEIAARAISGFTEAGYYAAFLRDGGIAASTPGYEALGIAPETVRSLVVDVVGAPDRLVKRRIPAAGRRIPAGIARLSDEPAMHLLVVVDDPEFYREADFPQDAPAPSAGRAAEHEPDPDLAAEAEAAPAALPAAAMEEDPAGRDLVPGGSADDGGARPLDEAEDAPQSEAAPAGQDGPRGHIDRWYFEADIPGSARGATAAASGETPAGARDAAAGGDDGGRPAGAPAAAEPQSSDEAAPTTVPDRDRPAPARRAAPPFTRTDAPIRFAWRTGADGRFSAMSREFLTAVQASDGAVIGRSFADVAADLGIDPEGEIEGLLARRDTWSGKTVLWPLADTGWRAPVDLAALPVYARDRRFEGFRGFGIARPADSVFVPLLVPVQPEASAQDETGAIAAEAPGRVEAPGRPADDADAADAGGGDPEAAQDDRHREDGPETDGRAASAAAAREAADTEEPTPEASGQTGAAATTVVAIDEARSRRFSDKIIRLAEHRGQPSDHNLSPGERNAFREIGDRLKKVTEPREEPSPTADATAPGQSADPAAAAADAEADAAGSTRGTQETAAPAPDAAQTTDAPAAAVAATRGSRPPNPFFIEVEEELSEAPIEPRAPAPAPVPAGSMQDGPETPGGIARGAAAAVAAEASAEPASADASDERMGDEGTGDAAPPVAERGLGPEARLSADNENGLSGPGDATPRSAASPSPEAGLPEAPFLPSAFAEGASASCDPAAGSTVLARLPLPVLVHAGDVLHFANQSFLDFTGYPTLADLDSAGGLGALFAEPGTTSDPQDAPAHSAVLRQKDGSTMPVRAHLQSIPWGRGKALLLALRPAEPRQEETAEVPASDLAARVEEMRTILDTATDGVVVIALDGTIRSINRPAEALFGYDDAEVAGKPFASLLAVESQRAARDYLQGLSDNGVASVLNDGREVIGREAQGRFIPLFMTIGRLPGGNGFCAVLRDITSWKRAEEELTKARTLAERSSSQKSEFLARVSHEIRTPLNAIIGFSQILERDSGLDPRQQEQIATVARSGQHLLGLINDILDLSKIEAGRLALNPGDFNLHLLLDDLAKMFGLRAEAKGLHMHLERASDVPRHVRGDEGKLRQVLINLLGNAIKFTATGAVSLRAGCTPPDTASTDTGTVQVWFEVEDTGPGISEADQALLFRPFQQAEAGRKSGGGTGLGLSISQRLLRLMGGGISLRSTPGHGSCFRAHLPLAVAQETEPPHPREPGLHAVNVQLAKGSPAVRVLVVDDLPDNRRLLHDVLQPAGFTVLQAHNGAEALTLFEQHAPHAVLMDMRMPVMDGYEATRRIKASPNGAHTPVIAVTASALQDDRQAIMDCGVDAYLSKPIVPLHLFAKLQELLHLNYQAPAEEPAASHTVGDLSQARIRAHVPPALRQSMCQALDQGDMAQLNVHMATLATQQPDLAQGLQRLATDFEYDTLQQLLACAVTESPS